MAAVPVYNFSELSGDGVEQLGQYEDILTAAHDKGIVNYPPSNANETYDVQSQRIRLQTFSSRLHLLGYLRHKISPKKNRQTTRRYQSCRFTISSRCQPQTRFLGR